VAASETVATVVDVVIVDPGKDDEEDVSEPGDTSSTCFTTVDAVVVGGVPGIVEVKVSETGDTSFTCVTAVDAVVVVGNVPTIVVVSVTPVELDVVEE